MIIEPLATTVNSIDNVRFYSTVLHMNLKEPNSGYLTSSAPDDGSNFDVFSVVANSGIFAGLGLLLLILIRRMLSTKYQMKSMHDLLSGVMNSINSAREENDLLFGYGRDETDQGPNNRLGSSSIEQQRQRLESLDLSSDNEVEESSDHQQSFHSVQETVQFQCLPTVVKETQV